MDALESEFEGYTRGHPWNGWATPYFEEDVAERVIEESNALEDGTHTRYDAARDVFVHEDESYPDEPVLFEPFEIETEGRKRKVYPIGTGYWTWEEKRPEESR